MGCGSYRRSWWLLHASTGWRKGAAPVMRRTSNAPPGPGCDFGSGSRRPVPHLLVTDWLHLGCSLRLWLIALASRMLVGACVSEDALNDFLYPTCGDWVRLGTATAIWAERYLPDEGDPVYGLHDAAVRTHPRGWGAD